MNRQIKLPAPISDTAKKFIPVGAPEIVGMELERDAVSMTMLTGVPTILVGHTGVAKTRLLQKVHEELGWPYRTIPGHGQIEVDTLIGKIWVENGSMNFRPGILPFCMKEGIAVGIQEINAVVPEVLILLHEFLDEGYITITDLPADHDDFIITPHPNFRLYGTMNPPELYPGVRDLSPALTRRCVIRRVGTLDAQSEARVVIAQTGISEPEANQLVQVATAVRENFDANKGLFWISTADLVMWAQFAQQLDGDLHKAAELAIYGKAPAIEEDVVRGFVRTAIGARNV